VSDSAKSEVTSQKSKVRSPKLRPARPVVVVSKCLLGERCRYDGKRISVPWIRELDAMVRFVPVCPETGIGLPVPRDPIRLVKTDRGIRLVETGTGRGLTAKARSFSRRFLTGLAVDGFILKARSPSCAVRDAAVYEENGEVAEEIRPGLFADAVLGQYPLLPVEDEERLAEPTEMLRFMGRLFDVRP
jgi:uncharacterized protein YbbK (DUF523 family)